MGNIADVHYCDRDCMDLERALALRKKYLQCNSYFGECDGNCNNCDYNFSMTEYYKAQAYVWRFVEEVVNIQKEILNADT